MTGLQKAAEQCKDDRMRLFTFTVAIVAFATIAFATTAFATTADAQSLTLACVGTVTSAGVSDPFEASIIVDFERRTLTGLWAQLNGAHDLIPITMIDAHSVTFHGNRNLAGMAEESIEGSVDRITGKLDAFEITPRQEPRAYDLRCKPTKSLF